MNKGLSKKTELIKQIKKPKEMKLLEVFFDDVILFF